jgi:PspA-Associated protein
VIVRILSEGQYRIDDGAVDRLNGLDNDCVAAVSAGDEGRFRTSFDSLLELVRSEGEALGAEDLDASDVIFPPPDISLEEASREFTGDGLIPD